MPTSSISGGDRLLETLKRLSQSVSKGALLKVGFLVGTTYDDGTPVALIAAIQNFGAPSRNIPPRPFFTNMVARESPGWGPLIAVELVKAKYDAAKALNRVGGTIKGQLQLSIRNGPFVPLKPVTIARKKSSKPLIDTSKMIKSVDWKVEAT